MVNLTDGRGIKELQHQTGARDIITDGASLGGHCVWQLAFSKAATLLMFLRLLILLAQQIKDKHQLL